MISKYKPILFIFFLALFSFILAKSANAATLMLIPEKQSVKIGEEVNINVKVDTEGESMNAIQATIQFSSTIFEAIKIEKTDSVFNFWLEEPTFSNVDGEAKFMGGTSKGVSGKSLQILKLTLKARGSGLDEINLSDAVVIASDGGGTNILSRMEGANISVGAETVSIPSLPSLGQSEQPATQPQIIVRTPVPAKNLPLVPNVRVPLYPEASLWYNHVGETIALWDVPDDIINVSAVMNQNPNTQPTSAEEKLSTGKNFGTIVEGVWYLHVRFKNNVGWGATAHYKISLDTTPPLPFEIKIDNLASDNPSPQIIFDAKDAFSGISHALIFVDGKEVSRTTATAVTLPIQAPGMHTLLVRIFDIAGSSVEDELPFEILPLPTPIIEFISASVSQGELIFASGTAIPNAFVDVRILDTSQQEVFKTTAQSDSSGNWKITADKVLATGKYALSAAVRDELGAVSFSTPKEFFRVRPKTILSLGRFINLGWFEIFIIFMLLMAAGASIYAWWYAAKKNTRNAYRIMVGRDIEKLTTMLSGSLKELENHVNLPEPSRSASIAVFIERMKDTIAKMRKYIDQEVNKLK